MASPKSHLIVPPAGVIEPIANAASLSFLPLVVMAVYVGVPVGVALLMVTLMFVSTAA